MGVRNSRELGDNLFKIATQLLENARLRQLLKNTGRNPFETEVQEKIELLHKNLLVVPLVDEADFDREGKIVILIPNGEKNGNNDEFKNIYFDVLIYTVLDTWVINDTSLRPFLIMSEVENSLKDKRINGIGKIKYLDFELELLTDKISCYKMEFEIEVFN
jgi:hypothetical protein